MAPEVPSSSIPPVLESIPSCSDSLSPAWSKPMEELPGRGVQTLCASLAYVVGMANSEKLSSQLQSTEAPFDASNVDSLQMNLSPNSPQSNIPATDLFPASDWVSGADTENQQHLSAEPYPAREFVSVFPPALVACSLRRDCSLANPPPLVSVEKGCSQDFLKQPLQPLPSTVGQTSTTPQVTPCAVYSSSPSSHGTQSPLLPTPFNPLAAVAEAAKAPEKTCSAAAIMMSDAQRSALLEAPIVLPKMNNGISVAAPTVNSPNNSSLHASPTAGTPSTIERVAGDPCDHSSDRHHAAWRFHSLWYTLISNGVRCRCWVFCLELLPSYLRLAVSLTMIRLLRFTLYPVVVDPMKLLLAALLFFGSTSHRMEVSCLRGTLISDGVCSGCGYTAWSYRLFPWSLRSL